MASNTLGSIKIVLGLDAAEFTTGMTKAEYQAQKSAEKIRSNLADGAKAAGAALALIAVGAVAALAGLEKLVGQVANFQDLSEKTGASAEGLASFAVAAAVAGTSVDDIANASVKLTKNLVGVDDNTKAAGAALEALGLNIKDFKKLAPEDQISAISKALGGFEDGAGKTAIATTLLGKSGAELLPFLKELENQGGRQVVLTNQQIAQADDYKDRQAKLRAEINQYAQVIAVKALPSVVAFTGAIADTLKEIIGLGGGVNNLQNNSGVEDFADSAVKALAFVVDSADGVVRVFQIVGNAIAVNAAIVLAVAKGDLTQAKNLALDGQRQISAILDRETFSSKLKKRLEKDKQDAADAAANATSGSAGTKSKPTLNFQGPTDGADAASARKKVLDNALKDLERSVAQEGETLQSRNKFLDLYNSENLISFQDYYAARKVAQQENVAESLRLYDQEIAALQKFKDQSKKGSDREDATGKINDLLDKKAKLQRTAGEEAIVLDFKEAASKKALELQIRDVNAQLLELQGNTAGAAVVRLEDQFKSLRDTLQANGKTADIVNLDNLIQGKKYQSEFTQALQQTSDIQTALGIQEDRISTSRETGAISEIEQLTKTSDARKAAVIQGEAIVANLERIAALSGNNSLVLQAEQARNALEKLRGETDLLGQKFDTIFKDSANTAFSDFISGTKSAKDAFRSFADDVVQQIGKIATQQLTDQLFSFLPSGSGGASGVGGFLSGLFGGGKAVGGAVNSGSLYRVNENRPEMLSVGGEDFLMMGNKRGNVNPNPKLDSSNQSVYNVSINVPTQTSRTTGTQLAAEFQKKLAVGNRNR